MIEGHQARQAKTKDDSDSSDSRLDYNEYIGRLDFIITLVVVNSNSSSLTQIVN